MKICQTSRFESDSFYIPIEASRARVPEHAATKHDCTKQFRKGKEEKATELDLNAVQLKARHRQNITISGGNILCAMALASVDASECLPSSSEHSLSHISASPIGASRPAQAWSIPKFSTGQFAQIQSDISSGRSHASKFSNY